MENKVKALFILLLMIIIIVSFKFQIFKVGSKRLQRIFANNCLAIIGIENLGFTSLGYLSFCCSSILGKGRSILSIME